MHLVQIRPENAEKGAAFRFSDQIINELRKEEELAVVGFGIASSLACMAIQRSISIANIAISEISLDYVGPPTLGIGGIFVVLNKESKIDWEIEKQKLESKMKLTFDATGQVVILSRNLSPDRIIPLCLSKVSKSELLKIGAAGSLINRAVPIALELTRGNIAKDPLGLELVTLSTVQFEVGSNVVLETSIDIYVKKGAKTCYTPKHAEIVKMLG